MSMVFQDPLTSLTPHLTVGEQVAEPLVRHRDVPWSVAFDTAVELLERVGVTDPARRARQFPHELSGGMRQRVMIAMALACAPKLIIADEPTTALDVTIQAQILSLLLQLKRQSQMAMVLVTHDFGVVAGVADRVIVMRQGRIVEEGPTAKILKRPENAYTRSLLSAVPRIDDAVVRNERASEAPLLEISNLQVHFPVRSGFFQPARKLQAVEGVGLVVQPGEAVGIVGESGSGKSTLARAALQLVRPTGGRVVWLGKQLDAVSPSGLKSLRRDMQLVFQDPLASLDPRMTVHELVDEPLRAHRRDLDGQGRKQLVSKMLARVGLGANLLNRYPHELSGGQAQRVGIARAMVLQPRLLICDEAVSALDVSVQGQIVTLLQDLKREYGTAILFIESQPGGRATALRPRPRALPRPDDGAGRDRRALSNARTSLYPGPARSGTGARSRSPTCEARQVGGRGIGRRAAVSAGAAARLRLQYTLPARAAHLPRAGADLGGRRRLTTGGVPSMAGYRRDTSAGRVTNLSPGTVRGSRV